MRLKLTLEYDGTGFRGWAAQPGLRTVEGSLRAALDDVFPRWAELAVAGRTDTGVHALGQVASVEVEGGPPPERAAEALNAVLPDDVAVVEGEAAPDDFHARSSARSRTYRYRIFRRREPSPFEHRRSWWLPRPLDEERLAESADLLLGEHDFTAFTPTETSSGRTALSASAARFAGGPPSTSTLATCPSACTPVSVRPATASSSQPGKTPSSAARSEPSTVRSPGCAAQPRKPVPSYSSVSLSRTSGHPDVRCQDCLMLCLLAVRLVHSDQ